MVSKKKSSPSISRKRRHSGDGDGTPNQANSGVSPSSIKRARPSTNTSITDSSDQSSDVRQKTLILGLIRHRLSELDSRTLYVRKLPRNTTLEQLKTLCPTSVNARIQSKKFANRRKHAFIEFKSNESAKAAAKSANGKLLGDRPILAQLCSERLSSTSKAEDGSYKEMHWRSPEQRQLNEFSLTALHVSCIPRSATQDEIRALFAGADDFEFHMNPKQKGIGSCRISFSSHEAALELFKLKHGTLLRDCPLIVNFAFKKHKPRAGKPAMQSGIAPDKSSICPTEKERQSNKQKQGKPLSLVNEPEIVPTYCAPLGVKKTKGLDKMKKSSSGPISSPIPKKIKIGQKPKKGVSKK